MISYTKQDMRYFTKGIFIEYAQYQAVKSVHILKDYPAYDSGNITYTFYLGHPGLH